MNSTEGAFAQRAIMKTLLMVLIESRVIDLDDTIASFREARRQVAGANLEPHLRKRLLREFESLLSFLETSGPQKVH